MTYFLSFSCGRRRSSISYTKTLNKHSSTKNYHQKLSNKKLYAIINRDIFSSLSYVSYQGTLVWLHSRNYLRCWSQCRYRCDRTQQYCLCIKYWWQIRRSNRCYPCARVYMAITRWWNRQECSQYHEWIYTYQCTKSCKTPSNNRMPFRICYKNNR